MSHNTEESKNSSEFPQLGEIKSMCKQCVPGALPFFVHTGGEAILRHDRTIMAEAITTRYPNANKQHKSLSIALTTYH